MSKPPHFHVKKLFKRNSGKWNYLNVCMTSTNTDPLWPVVKPRNAEPDAIEQMNAKMMAFHPGLHRVRRENHKLMHEAHGVLQADVSISELFRRIIAQ